MHSTYEQELKRLDGLAVEAKQGSGPEFFQDLLFRLDLIARDWAFFQIRGEITVEEHTELIRRKFELIRIIEA